MTWKWLGHERDECDHQKLYDWTAIKDLPTSDVRVHGHGAMPILLAQIHAYTERRRRASEMPVVPRKAMSLEEKKNWDKKVRRRRELRQRLADDSAGPTSRPIAKDKLPMVEFRVERGQAYNGTTVFYNSELDPRWFYLPKHYHEEVNRRLAAGVGVMARRTGGVFYGHRKVGKKTKKCKKAIIEYDITTCE